MSRAQVKSEFMLKTILDWQMGPITHQVLVKHGGSRKWASWIYEFIELHNLLTLCSWLPLWHFNNWFKVWINVCLLASVSYVQISESTGLENVNEPGEPRERGRGFPRGSAQDNVRFVWPECMNTKLFGTGSPPRYLPISPGFQSCPAPEH